MAWQVSIPRAVQLVIDDVGWREGWRLDAAGGPYRAGVDRLLGAADYEAISQLGQALGIRPTAATILCEWDRDNVCAQHPTSTPAGTAWDNRARAGDWSDEAAEVFRSRAPHLELALHGVGHEHWEGGVMTRAEWLAADGRKWSFDALRGHIDCYRAILDQHGLGPADGHRFPLSFVPCAFCYGWDDADPTDTGALMAEAGGQWVSTPFAGALHRRSPLLAADGGLNRGRLVLDRGGNGVPWHAVDQVPEAVQGAVPDQDRALLDAAAADVHRVPADELDLLFLRRSLGQAADRRKLVDAYLPLVIGLARLHTGPAAGAQALLSAGREALDKAVATWDADSGVAFDVYAEEVIRRAFGRLLTQAGASARRPATAGGGSICGVHWPNLLRLDPAENGVAVEHWAAYLRQVAEQPGQMLAANAREAFAQWAWHTFGTVEAHDDGFTVDTTAVPADLLEVVGAMPVVVDVSAWQRLGRLEGDARPVWYRRQDERAFVGLAGAAGRRARLTAGDGPLEPVVYRDGTFNVLDVEPVEQGLAFTVEVYGTQELPIAAGFTPVDVTAEGDVRVVGWQHNPVLGLTRVRVGGDDIQGAVGRVVVAEGP